MTKHLGPRTPSHQPMASWGASVRGELDAFLDFARRAETYAPVLEEIERLVGQFRQERSR